MTAAAKPAFKPPVDFSKDTMDMIKNILSGKDINIAATTETAPLETLQKRLDKNNKAVKLYLSPAELHRERHFKVWRAAAAVVATGWLTSAVLAVTGVIGGAVAFGAVLFSLPIVLPALIAVDIWSETMSLKHAAKREEKLKSFQAVIAQRIKDIKTPPPAAPAEQKSADRKKVLAPIKNVFNKAGAAIKNIFKDEPDDTPAAPQPPAPDAPKS